MLARCVSNSEAKERLKTIHEQWCGEEGPPLHRLLERARYFRPTMANDALKLQRSYKKCSEPPDMQECHFVGTDGDWRRPYIDYLTNGVLLANHQNAKQLKWRVKRFFIQVSELFKISFAGKPLKCVSPTHANSLLKKVHGGSSGEH